MARKGDGWRVGDLDFTYDWDRHQVHGGTATVTLDGYPDCRVRLRFGGARGVTITEVRMSSNHVTTGMLRSLKLEQVLTTIRERVAEELGAATRNASPDLAAELRSRARDFVTTARPARRTVDDLEYVALAVLYRDAMRRGVPHPVQVVAKYLGCNPKTVRNALDRAKNRDLIDNTQPGKPGFDLTRKARRLARDAGWEV